ncbi:MAG: hypothetical protein FD174_2401 [Geobacteraceae bacterium]|nr:MAG: hypothetical protein FD174_2401 [Geobacteraceae bacterium]
MLALFIAVPLVFPGCKKKEVPQPASAPQPKPVVNATLPIQQQPSSARVVLSAAPQLDFSSKKDPFKPLVAEKQPSAKPEAVSKTSEALPLQSYDVNSFKVSGIIVGMKENRALIVDPAGKGYVVKSGMQIGNNDGRISKISASAVEIVEQYRDEKGQSQKRTVKLTLAKKSKETSR